MAPQDRTVGVEPWDAEKAAKVAAEALGGSQMARPKLPGVRGLRGP